MRAPGARFDTIFTLDPGTLDRRPAGNADLQTPGGARASSGALVQRIVRLVGGVLAVSVAGMYGRRVVDKPSDRTSGKTLPPPVETYLRETNPWWAGRPRPPVPPFRRWGYHAVQRKLRAQLAPAVVLRGPRQIGKTTIQMQIIDDLLREPAFDPRRVLRVQFDDLPPMRGDAMPLFAIAWWYEKVILGRPLNGAARANEHAYLFFDELQNVPDWAPQLKALVDHYAVRVVVTGSSAFRIAAGRDSLAGRVATVEMGPLLLREVAGLRWGFDAAPSLPDNGFGELRTVDFWRGLNATARAQAEIVERAATAFSHRGGYPLGHLHPDLPWHDVADQLNETVIRRVIAHDLRTGGRGRDGRLFEELVGIACRYAGQAPGRNLWLGELSRTLEADVRWQRVQDYLQLLDDTLIVRLIEPLGLRLRRGFGHRKICMADHALRASWLGEVVPLDDPGLDRSPHLADLAGRIAESTVGAFLADIRQIRLHHFPERTGEPEVDFVLTAGEYRIPLEVKFRRRIDPHRDTRGLRSFLETTAYNAPFGVLVTRDEDVQLDDSRIVPVSLRALLWMR